ncbi:DegV domain-containing protein [Berryella intestinalis]|uniref:DegV domain-containing protein n=1 Tax=Berryella intestinalis TaxID=1531429 RepID=A0A0A8B3G0_9ACTN|nr:DegV family protein [Berryella intestinalis]AJC11904.1 DegV domain-containing protein [Berryella intestinalis]
MDFELVTDTSSNLVDDVIERFGIHVLPLQFTVDGTAYQSYLKGEKSDLKRFYTMMREGKVITTSLPILSASDKTLRGILERGKDLLYLGFSSGLSGTFQATALLLDQLAREYPERTVLYVDTLAASGGEGLLVYKAALMASEGASIREVRDWVEENKLRLAHWFTVDDLMFLFRGGRVSRTSAWAGTMLNIKPVMHVDDEGHLVPLEKVRGRKKSIQGLFKHMEATALEPVEEQTVYITHGDCPEDAEALADLIRKRWEGIDITINYIDPVIGAHSGPGTLALFFLATGRK